jgi:cyclophilin family peptidyl-prolyl cis-trans isomerase|tara:strand:+ start:4558 stop:5754 length:1197 start_codon:yes stop_codon:yes gene_type:complete
MSKFLKIPFIALAAFFLTGCGDPEKDALEDALLGNGIDLEAGVYNQVINKKQASCIVKNIKDLSNDREWELFLWQEIEAAEMSFVDMVEGGYGIYTEIVNLDVSALFDRARTVEDGLELLQHKWDAIEECDKALWSRMQKMKKDYEDSLYEDEIKFFEDLLDNANQFVEKLLDTEDEPYDDSLDNFSDETAAGSSDQSEDTTNDKENYALDNTATLINGLSAGIANNIDKEFTQVIIKTSEGEIKLELNNKKAPITVENFITIANSGYYEGTIFHRVINNFMIQGGGFTADMIDKSSGTAPIQNEANNGLSNDRGTIAMARTSAPHSATSQFFINHKDNSFLNHTAENSDGWGYVVFGIVTEGMDIVDQIANVATMSYKGFADVPVYDITIESVTIIE